MLIGMTLALCVAPPIDAQSTGSPLCKVGASVAELLTFSGDVGFPPSELNSSLTFLAECPSSFVPAFTATDEPDSLRARWLAAVRAAARDSTNSDLRTLLAIAQVSLSRSNDSSLIAYLNGLLDEAPDHRLPDQRALTSLFARETQGALRGHAACGGAACYNLSDEVLYLLGAHPVAALEAMRADTASAAKWLRSLADDSFSGDPDRRGMMEAVRRTVLATLGNTRAPGFERELRASTETLRRIRYRSVD